MMRLICFLLLFTYNTNFARVQAQTLTNNKPEVGMPMPDFKLSEITYYSKKSATLKDFKGKWLFLDFWSELCFGCIRSFPKMNELQKIYGDNIQIMLVGINNYYYNRWTDIWYTEYMNPKTIRDLYEKVRVQKKIIIPTAYDSTLAKNWNIETVPRVFIIDPNGVLRYISTGAGITIEKVNDMLEGKKVFFDESYASDSVTSPLYQSTLSKWAGESGGSSEIAHYIKFAIPIGNHYGFKAIKAPLWNLYKIAYFGRTYFTDSLLYETCYPEPVLEIKDSSVFQFDFVGIDGKGKGIYNYDLLLPASRSNEQNIMKIMQEDLRNAFGYRTVLEIRKMPVWKLVSKSGAIRKLRSKSKDRIYKDSRLRSGGIVAKRLEFRVLVSEMIAHRMDYSIPLFDETGIDSNMLVDIDIDADLTTPSDNLRMALKKYNLDMIKGEREMKVVVVRDL